MTFEKNRRQRIQSVENAVLLLTAFDKIGRPASLSELAKASGMAPAKAHRYLSSLIITGMVNHASRNDAYSLGPAAISLGIAALRQNQFTDIIASTLSSIRDATKLSCFASVIANAGPTVISQAESLDAIALSVRIGSVLPYDQSATGQAFLSGMNDKQLAEVATKHEYKNAGLKKTLKQTKQNGFAAISGTLKTGVDAIAMPVFNRVSNELAGAITILGPTGSFDLSATSQPAVILKNAISKIAGHK